MHPIICQLGPFTIYSFGLMLAIAVLLCSFLLSRDAKAVGIPQQIIFDFAFWVILSGIIGARIFFILLNSADFLADPKQMIMIQNGGLAWQGGLVFGVAAGIIFVLKKQLPILLIADLTAPYLALGQAIGRLGCFLNGCCYGLPASWGIYFPVHHDQLHPTQLYDTIFLIAIFFILKRVQKNSRIRGEVFCLYLILASIERFGNEFFRADHVNTWLGLSIFQIVSLVICVAGMTLWRQLHHRAQSA